jgi:ribosomal protein S19
VPSTLIDEEVYIHNGRFIEVFTITSKMVGHKLGEFCVTKILGKDFRIACDKKKKKKRNKKKK